ncbi:MAG TPA: Ig-like domain-containing protein [Gemmatimonadaceae bacterium]|nr:Ig-like domain-containing protein [Gemmatimonadaceae bacterium]
MRRPLIAPVALSIVAAFTALGGSVACASASPPPGGVEDRDPPKLVAVTPDSNALNVRARTVLFQFDETINDRGSGAQEIDNFFLVSPSDGNPRVSWRRSRIEVRPRNGFRDNTAYTVTLLPGLSDLRGNVSRTGASVVFSTGPTIPPARVTGIVFDWVAERPAARALIQAVTSDSTIYLAQSDSVGRFTVGPLPEGSYLVRAIVDANNNRALDRSEAFDTARVVAPQAGPLELRAVARDTLPPRLASIAVADSLSLRVTFDRYLDPDQPPPATAFRLVSADSTVIPVLAALAPRAEQAEAVARQQALADSSRRLDSLAGKPLPPRPVPLPTAGRRGVAPAATPSAPPPYTALLLRTARPLTPNATFRLSVRDARGLSGRTQTSERSFTTPRAPAPVDTTRRAPPSRP